ncbi:MAG: tetratricopeptide repeat protein [Bacteroidetes bacterium]|nr:tetratricopeptide repeat protein [Bacteroidota bacterium]
MFDYFFLKQISVLTDSFRDNPLGTRAIIELNSPVKVNRAIEIFSESVLRLGFFPVTLKLSGHKSVDRQLTDLGLNHADHKLLINLTGWDEYFAGFATEKEAAEFLENSVPAFQVVRHAFIFWLPGFAHDAFYKYSPSVLKLCFHSFNLQLNFDFLPADFHLLKKKESHKTLEQKINILENQLAGLRGKESDIFEFANVLQTLASFYFDDGEFEKAFECYDQCSKMKGINVFNLAEYQHRMGTIYLEWSRYDKAREKLLESLTIRESLGDRQGIAQSWHQLGLLNFKLARYSAAIENWNNAVRINSEMDNYTEKAYSLLNLGIACMAIGNSGAAFANFTDALDILKKLENQPGIALVLCHIAWFHAETNKYAEAVKYYLLSRHLAEKNGFLVFTSLIDTHLNILVELLGQPEFLRLKELIKKGIEKHETQDPRFKPV